MLLLLDGHALVYRAFHALPELTGPTGEPTHAVYGFARMLFKAIEELRPTHVAAAFDTAAPTFRKTEWDAYKAQRPPTPDGLRPQFDRVYQLLQALGVPIYRLDGYEADDVLGALARQAAAAGLEVVILTGDTDALQLVGPRVRVMVPRQGVSDFTLYDPEKVRERYGLEPSQLADVRALRGDASDNIPGLPGVGEKTAARLLQEFGSVEALLEQLERLPARLRPVVAAHAEQVRRSKRLATIVTDLPVRLDLEAAAFRRYDRQRLLALCHELGFRSLVDQLPKLFPNGAAAGAATSSAATAPTQLSLFAGDAPAEASAPGGGVPNATSVALGYPSAPQAGPATALVTSADDLAGLAERLRAAGRFTVAALGTDPLPMRAALVGLAFAVGKTAWYVPLGHTSGRNAPADVALAQLGPVLREAALHKRGHDLKYSAVLLGRRGIELRGLTFDSGIAAYLLESSQRAQSLRDLAWSRLQLELPSWGALLGSGKKAVTLDQIGPETVAEYAGREAVVVERLAPQLEAELSEADQAELFHDLELPLVPVLAAMELAGVAIDVPYFEALSRELAGRLHDLEERIYGLVGHAFNLNSPAQLGQVLFGELKLPVQGKTRTGQYATGAEVLESLRGAHVIVDLILEHRQLAKLKSTYVDALPTLVHPETGRVHTSFNQTVAATGRLSSSDPNLQNIPIRTDLGRRVRRGFVAGQPGCVLLSADYSQVELRILAHMTHDPTLLETFQRGEDVHAATAAEVLGIPIEQVTPDQRRLAKMVNFGVLYGMSDYGLAERTGLAREEAARFIARYFERFATVKAFQERIIREAERTGYASSLLGRRRYVPEIRSPVYGIRERARRELINQPIQSTAADIIKIAMVRVHDYLREHGLKTRMILQVHDELLFEAPEEEVRPFAPVLCDLMANALKLDVPLVVDLKVGPNWEDLRPLTL